MVFLVFLSIGTTAINVNPGNATNSLFYSTMSWIKPINESRIGLNEPGKEIKFQQSCTNDSFEPDNNYLLANIISTDGIPQSHINTPATEYDWVKFSAIAGHIYEIRTRLTNDINQSDTEANDTLLYLYGSDGVTLLSWNDDVGYTTWYNGYYFYRESLISWTAPTTDVYYVKELQWGPTAGYSSVRDCHSYNLWVVDLTITPMLTLLKTSTTLVVTSAGQVVNYSYLLTNTSNVTLTGVALSDNKTVPDCPPLTTLTVGDSMECTATYTVTQTDIDNGGNLTNTATVRYDPSNEVTFHLNIPILQNPTIKVAKSSTTALIDHAGQVVPYNFLATNTGNMTLSGILLNDSNCDATPIYELGDINANDLLEISEAWIFTCSHTATQAEINAGGNLSNTVTAGSNESVISTDHLDIPITQVTTMELTKSGDLNMNVIPPNGIANVGDTVLFNFSVQNTGNVVLTNINVSDPLLPALICTITILNPGETDNCTASNNVYIIMQADIDAGSVANTASATGKDPNNDDVTSSDSLAINIPQNPRIGISKQLVGDPLLVSPGIWDVTLELLIKNYGNVALSELQVTDNLALTFPAPTTFTIMSISSLTFSLNWSSPAEPTDYDGIGSSNLLTGGNVLAVGGEGMIRVIVRIVPSSRGPFYNSATASGNPPTGPGVMDESSDGTDPDQTINCSTTDLCANNDNNPNNNTKPTAVLLAGNIFDPPFGIKSVNSSGLPVLTWTMVWINASNIVAQNAAVSDPIPTGTTYLVGSLSCTGSSILTTTTSCDVETPSITYPRGRVVWTGTIGPDLGATNAATANNELVINFSVSLDPGRNSVQNNSTLDADLNGNGDTSDPGELQIASASSTWVRPENPPTPTPGYTSSSFIIPETGFAPGSVTILPTLTVSYADLGDLWLEIPRLGLKMPIVGVPEINGKWDVSWLGNDAGWLNGSAYPTWNGNSVLTGHVTDANGNPGPFARLNSLLWDDKVIIHASGAQYVYMVRSMQLAGSGSVSLMMKHEELPWVTLVTCRGYDALSKSYVYRVFVRAILVEVK